VRANLVTSFLAGSSAPSARRAAGGAGAPSSHVNRAQTRYDEVAGPSSKRTCADLPRFITARNATHHRASDPIPNDLHAGARHQGRRASLRDGLRPPLTPSTVEQAGWLSGRWHHSGGPVSRTPCAPPNLCGMQQSHRMHRGRPTRTSQRSLRNEKVRGFESPQLHQACRSAAVPGVLTQELRMHCQHLARIHGLALLPVGGDVGIWVSSGSAAPSVSNPPVGRLVAADGVVVRWSPPVPERCGSVVAGW